VFEEIEVKKLPKLMVESAHRCKKLKRPKYTSTEKTITRKLSSSL
jgi:hypothetical protein